MIISTKIPTVTLFKLRRKIMEMWVNTENQLVNLEIQ